VEPDRALSEDVDIFLNPGELNSRAIDRELKRIRDVVAKIRALPSRPAKGKRLAALPK